MKPPNPRTFLTIATSAALWRISRRTGLIDLKDRVSRKAIMKLGAVGLGMIAADSLKWRSSAEASVLRGPSSAPSCMLSPEQTEGPYYIAREKVRRNIAEHKPGTKLKLRLTVLDASACKPIKGAAVDIWHCDAGGIYSGFVAASTGGPPGGGAGPTDKHTFLRGIQFTNSNGIAEFDTIYPGWYRGRTVHIHVKVHLHNDPAGHVVHTGQLYFSDALTSKVYSNSPYKSRASARDTFNSTDGIYQNGGMQSTLSMKRDGHGGFTGTIILGVRKS